MYTNDHSSAVSNSQRWKPKCLSVHEQIRKCSISISVEYYSVRERNELFKNATVWKNLKKYYAEKARHKRLHIMIPSIWNIQNRIIHRERKSTITYSELGGGEGAEWGDCLMIQGSFLGGLKYLGTRSILIWWAVYKNKWLASLAHGLPTSIPD